MTEPTKLPIKTETKEQAPAPGGLGSSFDRLRREIDRAFERFDFPALRSPFGAAPFSLEPAWSSPGMFSLTPAVDVTETEKDFKVSAELPGLDEKDIDVKVANGTLTIKGEKREEKEQREKDYYLSERSYGSFRRSFQIPQGVQKDKIEASFAKGVLMVTLPKSPEAQSEEKRIEVKAA